MEGYYRESAADLERIEHIAYCSVESVELAVDIDPQRLEGAPRGVASLAARRRRNRAFDYLGEFQCCFYRLFSPRSDYSRRYTRSELVLAVSVDDILQLAL